MKKFMVLYMANAADFERMMKESTPEQQKKGMEAWMKWMGDHKSSLDGHASRNTAVRPRIAASRHRGTTEPPYAWLSRPSTI